MRGFGQAFHKRKSRHVRLLSKNQIKICERCFLCRSIVFCQSCNKCPTCSLKLACRGQISNLLESSSKAGCRSESFTNVKTRLHPPLSYPAKLDKVSHHYRLPQKRSRTGQKSRFSRILQPTFIGPKTKQQKETYTRPEQSE